MSIFICVPEDVIKWVIIPFLTIDDRLAFNAALEPTERVYKKLPKDFVSKHALRIAYTAQRHHAHMINYLAHRAAASHYRKAYALATITEIKLYTDFLMKPVAAPLFIYGDSANAKAKAVSDISHFLSDSIIESYMTDEVRDKIRKTIAYVESR